MMCSALTYAAVCCASSAASGGLTITSNDVPRADIRCSVLCQHCFVRRAHHNDVRSSNTRCRAVTALRRPAGPHTDEPRADINAAVFCSCCAAPGSLAGYIAWLYAAGCCTCARQDGYVLRFTIRCWAQRLRSYLARYVALIYAAA